MPYLQSFGNLRCLPPGVLQCILPGCGEEGLVQGLLKLGRDHLKWKPLEANRKEDSHTSAL